MSYDVGFSEEESRGKLSLRAWGRILKFVGKKWPLFIVLVFCMLFAAFYDSSFILLLNKGLVDFFVRNPASSFAGNNLLTNINSAQIEIDMYGWFQLTMTYWQFIIVLVAGVVLRSLSIFALFFTTNMIYLEIMNNLRKDCFKKIQELSFSYFDKTPSGWLIARLENDTLKIAEVISWGLLLIIWPVAEWILTLITMFTSGAWIYALFIIIPMPIIFILAFLYNYRLLKKHRLARTTYSSFIRWLADCLAGIKTIKVLSVEKTTIESAEYISSEYEHRMVKVTKQHAIFSPLLNLVGSMTLLILIIVFTTQGDNAPVGSLFFITTAQLTLLIGATARIVDPIINISDALIEFMDAQASVEKIVGLLKEEIQINDKPEVVAKYGTVFAPITSAYEPMEGDVQFKDIRFSYIEGTEVLHGVTFNIPKGQTIAIVGETGSGKTTIANLMCRFYEPQHGQVLIDGVEYRDRSVGWLRSNIGYVEQNPLIFSLSLRENIKYGNLNASDEDIMRAIEYVGLTTTIRRFPEGLDKVLVDKGSELSMGERQLISFARAVIRDPKIIILDEATSNIDTETEMIVQASLKTILKNKTSLIIAHRLSTIVHSDKIIVLKDGNIIEMGNHKELLALHGYYYDLYMNQFAESTIDLQLIMAEDK